MKRGFRGAAVAGLLMAQLGSGSYSPGVPAIPGTRTPESSPATAVPSAPSAAPSVTAPGAASTAGSPLGTNSGPAYSFGAAPPPVVSPGH
ncbi:MAG TPA: hypothetical protein VMB84_19545 [Stellaceae bacterium]|nr:hypothetical protein [Stellaceae bacterium]